MPAKLIIRGNNSQITEETDVEFLLALDKHLSFFVEGAEHTAAYRGFVNRNGDYVKWDGFQKLMTPGLRFPSGLVERIKDFYQENGKTIEVVDKRPPKSVGQPIDILPRLNEMNIAPYDYQMEILTTTDRYDRGIIKSSTGSGKSLVAALIAAKLGKTTIIYVIGKGLLHQFYEFFSAIFDQPIGIVGDGLCEIHNINIVSVWTAGQAIGMKKNDILLENDNEEKQVGKEKYAAILRMIKNAKLQIVDECHMSACETIQSIFKNTTPEHIYGMSGTPWRDDQADLMVEAILGKYIANISSSRLIKGGYLAQPIIRFRVVPPLTYKVERVYQTIYKHYIVENDVRNGMILQAAQSLVSKGYQTLVLFNSLKHGKILYELFQEHMTCTMLDGSNSKEERDKAKDDLMNHRINCILASRVLDIGIDVPSLSGLVLAGSGKSTGRALQRVGRVIRKYPGKKYAAIIDFADQAPFLNNHSKARYAIYASEDGFDVSWPQEIKKPRKTGKKHGT